MRSLETSPPNLSPEAAAHARGGKRRCAQRLAIAQSFLDLTGIAFDETAFTAFFQAFQESSVLELHEVSAAVPALKLILLERIAARCLCQLNDPAASPTAWACACGACVMLPRLSGGTFSNH